MSDSATPQTAAHQAPLSTGFSRQESWSGLPFPSPNQSINRHRCTKFKIRIPNYYSAIFYQCYPWVFFFFHLFWQCPTPCVENAMAPHSSTLAWKIPWTEEPGRLKSMESLRVGHDWETSLSLFTFTHWRRKWQPTPVFLPGESLGRGSLVGCHLWGRTESDTTEVT